jgi:hypothetical protein
MARYCGLPADDEKWLTDVIKTVGPGGNYDT